MMKSSNLATCLFLFSILIVSVSSYASAHSKSHKAQQTEVGLYPSLLQFAVPTARMNCSVIRCLLHLFQVATLETTSLESASCVQEIFQNKISKLQTILNSSECDEDESTEESTNSTDTTDNTESNEVAVPESEIRCGDPIIWAIDQNHASWYRDPSTGQWTKTTTQQYGSNICYYIDRLPTCEGGYSWLIGVSSGPWWIKGMGTYWQRPTGYGWTFLYVRISPYDQSLWSITIKNQLQYAVDNSNSFSSISMPSGVTSVKYLDLSPKDGSCYVISSDYKVFYTSAPNTQWTELTGLAVLNLRIIENGYIFAIGTDKNAYYRTGNDGNWVQLEGQNDFIFLDVNNRGRIYAMKSDKTVYSREYIQGTWFSTDKSLQTFRVMDDGAAYGIGLNDVSSGIGHVWVRNGTTDGTWTQVAENNGFSGAYSLWGPSAYRFYWSENNVVFDETA